MQDKLSSGEEVCLHDAGCSTAYPLSGEKSRLLHSPEEFSMLCGAELQHGEQSRQQELEESKPGAFWEEKGCAVSSKQVFLQTKGNEGKVSKEPGGTF